MRTTDFYKEKLILAQEILGKADLQYVADHIQEFSEWNLMGTSPNTLCDLPIKILRCFNTPHGVEVLKEEHARNLLKTLYVKSIQSFNRPWNPCQCMFWTDFSSESSENQIDKNTVKIVEMMGRYESEGEYERFKHYSQVREAIEGHINLPVVPAKYEYEEVLQKADFFLDCVTLEEKINLFFLKHYRKVSGYYEYEDEKYAVIMLKSLKDFINESEKQKNCLWTYILDACVGEVTILALRKKEAMNKPYITMEIQGTPAYPVLKQAKRRYNEEPEKEAIDWISDYCNLKKIETIDCEDLHIKTYGDFAEYMDEQGNLPF